MSGLVDLAVERMLSTLLYEGYALYPYTPGATKNATPTPFGIVYPPAYAAGGGWVRLQEETLQELSQHRADRGLHSLDDAVRELLHGGERG